MAKSGRIRADREVDSAQGNSGKLEKSEKYEG